MTEEEKQSFLTIKNFPRDLRRSLKMVAAEKEQSMASLIIQILQQWVEKN